MRHGRELYSGIILLIFLTTLRIELTRVLPSIRRVKGVCGAFMVKSSFKSGFSSPHWGWHTPWPTLTMASSRGTTCLSLTGMHSGGAPWHCKQHHRLLCHACSPSPIPLSSPSPIPSVFTLALIVTVALSVHLTRTQCTSHAYPP